MSKLLLDEAGAIVGGKVRDDSLEHWKKILAGQLKGDTALEWSEKLSKLSPRDARLVRQLIPEVVDTVLHWFLFHLEQEEGLDLVVGTGSERVSVREISDGMSGELYGDEGWIARFSKIRL
jgi:hypothetical protein